MNDNFDPIGGIIADIVTAVVALLLGFVVDPLNALLAPIFNDPAVIDLTD